MLELISGFALGAMVVSVIAIIWYRQVGQPNTEKREALLQSELDQRRREAAKEAERIENTARAEAQTLRSEAEKAADRRFKDVARSEERVDRSRAEADRRLTKIEQREQRLNKRQSSLDRREAKVAQAERDRELKLEEVASMTRDEARQQLLTAAELEARQDMARVMREVEERARENADVLAQKHIATSIQRVASSFVAETTSTTVQIPSEEMKGRIIGRNGRNIRAFEQAAGVDIVVDDTPEAVSVSSFDPVRREVAARALDKLIVDGRIHPARIEKIVKDMNKEVEKVIREAGENAAYEANVHGLHKEITKMLGRLRFRTSYGQNQLGHAIETSKIAGMLAAEIGADVELAKMGGLLHDLGKAMDHNQEGTHAMLGAEYAKRFKVPPLVVNAIASHHHEVEQETVEAILVEAADAISGARPGARRESLENYIKRVRTLEEIAASFEGVENAYALQAGREIRILVKPGKVDDLGAIRLSKEIAKTIEDNMQYPGQIQVTIIRETRAVNFAK
ncbi:MAG: ribonuclease Y [Candidatus Promineifilaceae bacterium]